MLTASIYILGVQYGVDQQSPNQVQVGVVVDETDSALQYRRITGYLDWGDGGAMAGIPGPNHSDFSPYNGPASPVITKSDSIIDLSLVPMPYKGKFTLLYNGITQIGEFDYNVTTAALQIAINAVLQDKEAIAVEGSFPKWTLVCDSPDTADKISAGSDTLFAPVVMPVHTYGDGNFLLQLHAQNYRSPKPDDVDTNYQLILSKNSVSRVANQPAILGPILPLDASYPNTDQWNFNMSTDLQVLVSNVKMILIVEPGERLMMPEFGCGLRQFIFDPLDDAVEQDIEAEIRRAIGTWEPRIQVESVDLARSDRTISVALIGVSRLNQERFQLNATLER